MSKRVVSLLLTLLLTLSVCIPAFATAVEPADQADVSESAETEETAPETEPEEEPSEEEPAEEAPEEEEPSEEESSDPVEESSIEESTETEAHEEESAAEDPEENNESNGQSSDDIMTVASANMVDSGYCGDPSVNGGEDARWRFFDNGVLEISGHGKMDNYHHREESYDDPYDLTPSNPVPWLPYLNEIKYAIIEDGIESIGRETFINCLYLENVSIGNSVESIGLGAFAACHRLRNFDIPDSVTRIEGVAFDSCESLTSLTLPDSLEFVGYHAFYDCKSITSVTIPDSVTKIEEHAFGYTNLYSDLVEKKIPDFTIYGWTSSEAERYANENGFKFVSIGSSSSEGVTIRAEKTTIEVGEDDVEVSLTVTGASLIDGDVTWTSSNPEVLTVSANVILNGSDHASATVKGISEGKATVTATTKDGKTASLEITVVAKAEDPNSSVIQGIFNYYGAFGGKTLGTYKFKYSDDWFSNPSTTMQMDLIRMSMRMALAAYGNSNDEHSLTNSKNIVDLMRKIGFKNIDIQYPKPTRHSIGFVIGSKNVEKEDGEEFSLINISIRGGGYFSEWGGNFIVENNIDHEGWTNAKEKVLKGLEEYVDKHKEELLPNTKIWIQGFSRAGAVTNLAAKELDNGTVKGIDVPKENIYAFCFECPQTTKAKDRETNKYNNIISIANPADVVTKLFMSDMGYGRYGRTYFLPFSGGNYNYDDLWKRAKSILGAIALESGLSLDDSVNKIDIPYNETLMLDWIMSRLSRIWDCETQAYVMTSQEFLADTMEKFMGHGDPSVYPDTVFQIVTTVVGFLVRVIYEINGTEDFGVPGVPLVPIVLDVGFIVTAFNTGGPFSFHYPELCMAWLDSLEGGLPKTSHDTYRKVFINCPVDIKVYDSTGSTVGEFVNGEVVEDSTHNIAAYVDENGQMILGLPVDDEYRIELTATDKGTVTYLVSEYDMSTGNTERVVSYYEVDVESGDTLTGTVENLEESAAVYPLTVNGDPISPAVDQGENEVLEYRVGLTTGEGGTATGGGIFVSGEYAKAVAQPDDGYTFDGWYIDGKKVSGEKEYRFLVSKDTALEARFINEGSSLESTPTPTPKPDYGIIPDVPWYQYQPEDEGEYVPGPDEVTYSFPDVDPNAWYAGPVGWAAQSGVTAGYPDGNFHPDDTCTRAQIVTFLWKAAGTPMSVGTVSFSDVEQGSFYYDAAVWAANSGIIAGYPDGNFHPDDPCTRAQIVAMLYRYANSPAVSGESKFFDVESGAYYYNAAIWAEQNGIVAGYPDGGFHPDDVCTRAQIVTMLYNYIKG